MTGNHKPLRNTADLCALAGEMLRRAGFEHHCTSMRSISTYYRWPGREELLRVGTHNRKNARNSEILGRVAASITFAGSHLDGEGRMKIADDKVVGMVAEAIGRYMLNSASAPSAGWIRWAGDRLACVQEDSQQCDGCSGG